MTTVPKIGCLAVIFAAVLATGCKRSSTGGIDLLSKDETADAGVIVADANEDLKKIKVLYDQNLDKREELKKALEANDADKVKKISNDVVDLINDGTNNANNAIEKIQKAQDLEINDDYRTYLQLKESSVKKELDAFENYRQAARSLRDNYDPKNTTLREKVKEEFKTRSENYQKIMESARDDSSKANELAKDVLKRQQEGN